MKLAEELDVRAIRKEYERTHTATMTMSVAAGHSGHNKEDTTPEEAEFGRAMDRYKLENRRLYPTFGEVLAVLLAMGYRQVAEPKPLKGKGC